MNNELIPNYGLYGESSDSIDHGAIHIEDIADRSSDRDWLIKPHRHGTLFQVLCIFDGQLEVRLDAENHRLTGTWLVVIPAGVVHGFRFKPDSQGVVITVTEEVISDGLSQQGIDDLQAVFDRARVIEFGKPDRQHSQLEKYIDLLRHEFNGYDSARYHSLLLLIKLFLITVKRQIEQNALDSVPKQSNLKVLSNFRRLLEENYKQHWQVSDYAARLNVSTSTLNRMCRERYANNAKSIIQARLMAEARRRLIFTRQPLNQIAYFLGFKDPAYFSRLFRKQENISPGDYRKAAQQL